MKVLIKIETPEEARWLHPFGVPGNYVAIDARLAFAIFTFRAGRAPMLDLLIDMRRFHVHHEAPNVDAEVPEAPRQLPGGKT